MSQAGSVALIPVETRAEDVRIGDRRHIALRGAVGVAGPCELEEEHPVLDIERHWRPGEAEIRITLDNGIDDSPMVLPARTWVLVHRSEGAR